MMRVPVICFVFIAIVTLGDAFPTLPMESVSSGLAAMIHGQAAETRSTEANGLPAMSVPVVQSTTIPSMAQQLASNIPLVTLTPSNTVVPSSSVPPMPLNPTTAPVNVSKQGLFPSQITSLPGALASQMQGQMSQIQQQVTQVGGSLISQTQDQMSSLQSQMASIPSAIGSLVPSGLVPQRVPVSTASPSTVTSVPALAVTPPRVRRNTACVTTTPSKNPI